MKNQQVIYSNARVFESSSESQSPASQDETHGPREVGHKVFQYSGNIHELQKTLNNLTQQYQSLQSNNTLMKEMLKNKSRELGGLKRQKELDSSNREGNRCCGETKVLDCIQLTGKYVERYWFCSGIKCYFIMDSKHWSGCKQTCKDCSLSLLKIDDDDELKFLQDKVSPNTYWIGLSYDARKRKWQWIGEDPPNLDLMTVKSLQRSRGCATLSFKGINPSDCASIYPCICEKGKGKFPHSVCTMEEK